MLILLFSPFVDGQGTTMESDLVVLTIKWQKEKFEAALMHSDHGNMGHVGWCIVEVKQYPMC